MQNSLRNLHRMGLALLASVLLAGSVGCGNATSDPAPEPSTDSPSSGAATQSQEVHASPACETIEQIVVIDSESDLQQFAGNDCFKIEGHLFVQNTTDIEDHGDDDADKATYLAILQPLSTNTFGETPSGTAIFTIDGDSFTARVQAQGLDDAVHPQHIHGFVPVQDGTCPTAEDDANDDGFVDVLEGAPDYGPILLPLDGSIGNAMTDVSTLPTGSSYHYMESASLSDVKAAMGVSDLALEAEHVVVHGVSGDRSLPASVQSLAGLPANVTLPVACGQIIRIN